MKKLLLLFSGCCFALMVRGQNVQQNITVKGTVIDSATSAAMPYVTVSLQNAKTKQPVKAILSKENGSFELTAPLNNSYQLTVTFVGYKPNIIPITGTGGVVDLGKIILTPSSTKLNEVSITAAKPLMKQEVDRISYDVQADPESPALTALDMMRKVPLLAVDASDNILLKGSGNYKILINGKESALMAKDPSDILKAMPATNIERIEVITTPPAKYDAEGLSGIINIITKRNLSQGYNLGLNGRINSVFGPAINLNGTYKQGKFGLNAFIGVGEQRQPELGNGSTQTFFQQQSVLTQNGTNTSTGNFHYGDVEISYEIDTLNLVTASVDLFGNTSISSSGQLSDMLNSNGASTQFYNLANAGNSNFFGFDAAINYQLGFKHQKGRLLTLSYKYNYSPDNELNNNIFSQRLNYPQSLAPDYNQYNNSGSKVHTFQLDYEQPFKKLTMEAGTKAIFRNNFSAYHVDDRDSTTNQYITNPTQTNDFNYNQGVYSIYNSYQLNLEDWTAKAGLRLEHTTINADFASTGSTVNQDYNNFIPSLSVQRKFKASSINFGFTERIQRPGISQLNPFVDRTNPSYISFGNPNLRPELDHTFELTYSNFSKSSINAGFSYAFSNNSIQNVSGLQINNVGGKIDTVTTSTYQNLGSNSTLGFNINTTQNFTKKLSVNVNGLLNHIWLQGAYNGQFYKNQGTVGNIFANMGYTFDKGYRFGINAGYFTGNITLQGKTGSGTYSSPVISKTFLNKTATIALAVNNPFSAFQTIRSSTATPQYEQSSFNQGNFRSFAIRFNYRIGKLTSDIKKNEHGIENDDTKGGGKSSGGNQ